MLKYAKIINDATKEVSIALGSNHPSDYLEMNVEQAYTGNWYLEGYAPEKPEETLQEKLNRLEAEYQMPRYIREGILVEGSPYSDFTKARAQELEDIAEQIRGGN